MVCSHLKEHPAYAYLSKCEYLFSYFISRKYVSRQIDMLSVMYEMLGVETLKRVKWKPLFVNLGTLLYHSLNSLINCKDAACGCKGVHKSTHLTHAL